MNNVRRIPVTIFKHKKNTGSSPNKMEGCCNHRGKMEFTDLANSATAVSSSSSSSGFVCSQQVECYGSPLLSVLSISYTFFIA